MQQDGVRDWCQYFHFEHSPVYQKIQLRFWEAVDTFDPNSIAVSNTLLEFSVFANKSYYVHIPFWGIAAFSSETDYVIEL